MGWRRLSFSPAASLPCHSPSNTRAGESDAIPIPTPARSSTFLQSSEQGTQQLNINSKQWKMPKEIELEGSPGIVFLIILVHIYF